MSRVPCMSRVAAAALCVLIAGCGASTATQTTTPQTLTLGNVTVSGRNAIASAQGTVDGPTAIRLRVEAAPKQRVTVAWALVCPSASDRTRPAAQASGAYVATAPDVRALRLPARKVALCAIDATARLARSGDITITALADTR